MIESFNRHSFYCIYMPYVIHKEGQGCYVNFMSCPVEYTNLYSRAEIGTCSVIGHYLKQLWNESKSTGISRREFVNILKNSYFVRALMDGPDFRRSYFTLATLWEYEVLPFEENVIIPELKNW